MDNPYKPIDIEAKKPIYSKLHLFLESLAYFSLFTIVWTIYLDQHGVVKIHKPVLNITYETLEILFFACIGFLLLLIGYILGRKIK